ncbi:selenocysteine-specific translation elongation factor [Thalassorhabdus alkalitolerans]|uniref:Selenocysteine-specific elongation factor n=1 Tax=Thalassorhabdus alkalitolerans TaxID=2282697 RepID=A0ABW0YNF2_9BACI
MKHTYTIGMAGHIDHGKTTLTKALTDIDTDRLQEEKERNISIEPGFAPLSIHEEMDISIIDVPGHERFIRQMIAGVAGIDGVILVVAADEGVMPQTREHLEILSFLGITHSLIAVTKVDRVEEELLELVEEDIREEVQGTPFEHADLVFVDSLSGKGLDHLKSSIQEMMKGVPGRDPKGAFRLPIDQVFTVHGQGTVVRGTVYEGRIAEGETVKLLPAQKTVRARQLQVHKQPVREGIAGQRLAINLGGIDKEEVERGDVLVSADHYVSADTIDVELTTVDGIKFPLKQRGYIKLHLGTAEVYGKIVFFDRNVLEAGKKRVLCQVRLDEPVVTKRGDRFILRRPTPVETIGGGMVINTDTQKYKFGQETIDKLEKDLEGTPEDRIKDVLLEYKWLRKDEIVKHSGLTADEAEETLSLMLGGGTVIEVKDQMFTLPDLFDNFINRLRESLETFHASYPLRAGKNKSEILQENKGTYPKGLLEHFLDSGIQKELIKRNNQYISLQNFTPHFPKGWESRMENVVTALQREGLLVSPFEETAREQSLPDDLMKELRQYLLENGKAVPMDDKHIWDQEAVSEAKRKLRDGTNEVFTLQEAKEVLGVTRKYLVPFLEWLDNEKWTARKDKERTWLK